MARSFNGSSDTLTDTSYAGPDHNGTGVCSISIWVNITTLAETKTIIRCGSGSTAQWAFRTGNAATMGGSSYPRFDWSAGSSRQAWHNGSILTTGSWMHWLLTFDGNGSTDSDKLKMYINGVNRTLTFVGTSLSASAPAPISGIALGDGSSGLACKMAEFTVWQGEALGADEAAALYKGVSSLKIRRYGILNYVPLWGLSSTEAQQNGDHFGFGRLSLSATGTTVVKGPPIAMTPYRAR